MGLLTEEIFVCFDCESTGLDVRKDSIIEIAASTFTFNKLLDSFETLVDPRVPIPKESTKIHHITDDMVEGKPTIKEVLPEFLKLAEKHIVVGHSIAFDIDIVKESAKKHSVPTKLGEKPFIDTLRLARLYGGSPVNSLEKLREHFNIPSEGAHRAMSDVKVNIEVFKQLTRPFKTTEALLERLKKPVALKLMPLGKYRGRIFKDIPIEYLSWAINQDFDVDLIFSLSSEINKRKKGKHFTQASNPFADL